MSDDTFFFTGIMYLSEIFRGYDSESGLFLVGLTDRRIRRVASLMVSPRIVDLQLWWQSIHPPVPDVLIQTSGQEMICVLLVSLIYSLGECLGSIALSV